jgi:hypothetical protein
MTLDEVVNDILATYAATPEHLTGPPLVNWLPLWDGVLSDWAWLARMKAHPLNPAAVVKAHNTRARACRVADIKALAEKYNLDLQTVKMAIPAPRISSVTGGPVPSWPDAWEMVRDTIGEGPHTPATVRRALEAVGMTNVQYHLNSEAYPWWVTVKTVGRTEKQARRQITIGTGGVG